MWEVNKYISIIVAIAERNAIGRKNQLLCYMPDDLKRFRSITEGHTVVMGRKTFLSLPKGPLPDRKNVVLTDNPGEIFDGCEMAYSIQQALDKCDLKKENFIIGGGMIYKTFLPMANKLYITHIHKDFEDADTFFPEINHDEWEKISSEEGASSTGYPHTFSVYQRKQNLE